MRQASLLKKVIGWTLPTNAGEAMVVVSALLLGLALPVTAVQILWVNLITGITLGIALAFEPAEPGTMARPPRRRDAPILSGELFWHVVLVATLFREFVLSGPATFPQQTQVNSSSKFRASFMSGVSKPSVNQP